MVTPETVTEPSSYGSLARKGGAWYVWRHALSFVIQVPAAMIMARLLTPREFGVAAVATMVVQFGYRFTQFGLNASLVRAKELHRIQETSVLVFNGCVGLAVCGILWLASGGIGEFFGSVEAGRLIPFAGLVFLVSPLGVVPSAMMERRLMYRESAGIALASGAISAGSTIALAWAGASYWSPAAGALVGVVVTVVAQFVASGWQIGLGFSWKAMSEMLAFGGGVQLRRVIQYGAGNLDTLIVGRTLGVTPLGFYDKGFSTMARALQPLTFGVGVTFRILAAICDQPTRFRIAFKKIMTVAGLMSLPLFAGLACVAEELVVVMYGRQWLQSVPVFRWLCVAGACQLLSLYVGSTSEAIGRVWWQVTAQVVALLFLGVAVLTGARVGGVSGAAVGMAAAAVLELVLASMILLLVSPVEWRDLTKAFRAGLACAAGLVLALALGRQLIYLAGAESAAVTLAGEGVVAFGYGVAFSVWWPDKWFKMVAMDFIEDIAPHMPPRVSAWLLARFSGTGR